MYRAGGRRERMKLGQMLHDLALTRIRTPSTMARVWNLLLALLLLGQTTSSTSLPSAQAPGSDIRVFIVTMGPGDEAFEKFGHNMLWIHDSDRDLAYNWGVFNFEEPHFIWNFIQGRMTYRIEADEPADGVVAFYIQRLDRTVWIQELNLTPAQRAALRVLCRVNALPQNKFYKYDYFADNCSTRVRDAIDNVLGGQIKRQLSGVPSDVTYRSETQRLTAEVKWLYTSLDYALGHPTDRKLSEWDEMFIPLRMRERLDQITVTDENGQQVPLVKLERLIHTSSRPPPRAMPPHWVGWFFLVGLVLGGAMAGCAGIGLNQTKKWKRRTLFGVFAVIALAWSVLSALGGCFVSYTWLFTDHAATHPNENLLQLGPWMIAMIVLIPLTLRDWKRSSRAALYIAVFAAGASLVGLLLKVLPIMYQVNWNVIALAVPTNAGLAAALWKRNQIEKLNKLKKTKEAST
jgi:hypothetical protein